MKQDLSRMGGRNYGLVRRADGDAEEAEQTTESAAEQAEQTVRTADLLGEMIGGNQRRRAGLKVNHTFFPLSDILLFGCLVCLTVMAVRKR